MPNMPSVPMETFADFFCQRQEHCWNNSLSADDDNDFDGLASRLAQQGTRVQSDLCNKNENVTTKIQRREGDSGFCTVWAQKPRTSSLTPALASSATTLPSAFSCYHSAFMAEIDRANWFRAGYYVSIPQVHYFQRAMKDIHHVFQSLWRRHVATTAVMSSSSSELVSIVAMIIEMVSATLSSAAIFSGGQDPLLTTRLLPVYYRSLPPAATAINTRALSICVTISTTTRAVSSEYNRVTGITLLPLHHSQVRARPPPGSQALAGPEPYPRLSAPPVQGSLSREIYDLVAQSVQPLTPRRRAGVGAILKQMQKTMLQLTVELADIDLLLSKSVANIASLILTSAIWAVSCTHILWACSYLSLPLPSVPFLTRTFHRCGQWTTWDVANLLKVISMETPRTRKLPLLPRNSALMYHWMEWFRGVYGHCSIVNMTHHFGESWSQSVKDLYLWKKRLINSVLLQMLVVQDDYFFLKQGLFRVEFRAAKALETINERIEGYFGGSIDLYVRDLYPSGHLIPPGCRDSLSKTTAPAPALQDPNNRKRKSI